MMTVKMKLSLYELEQFDPYAPQARGNERRFLCPLCGQDKKRDNAHRSISVNVSNGAWKCNRCQSGSKLTEWWDKKSDWRERKRSVVHAKFSLKPEPPKPEPLKANLSDAYQGYKSTFPESPGAQYLESRGIPATLAIESGCGYAMAWKHWEKQSDKWKQLGTDRRVIFPIIDQSRNLIALSTRVIDSQFIGPKTMTRGEKKHGVFSTPGALEEQTIIITEAPIDALSLATVGYPAIALIGTSWPAWLILKCGFKSVVIAFDADEAGDKAAKELTQKLAIVGAKVTRLRPVGGKDWNEILLKHGAKAIREQMEQKVQGLTPWEHLSTLAGPAWTDSIVDMETMKALEEVVLQWSIALGMDEEKTRQAEANYWELVDGFKAP